MTYGLCLRLGLNAFVTSVYTLFCHLVALICFRLIVQQITFACYRVEIFVFLMLYFLLLQGVKTLLGNPKGRAELGNLNTCAEVKLYFFYT